MGLVQPRTFSHSLVPRSGYGIVRVGWSRSLPTLHPSSSRVQRHETMTLWRCSAIQPIDSAHLWWSPFHSCCYRWFVPGKEKNLGWSDREKHTSGPRRNRALTPPTLNRSFSSCAFNCFSSLLVFSNSRCRLSNSWCRSKQTNTDHPSSVTC